MCGIAGQFYFETGRPVDRDSLLAMLRTLRHRGPDDEGMRLDANVGIGMRRLSIIDLTTGHQPIGNEDDSVWIIYNGETYNYVELREELLARGHVFSTQSDTETILHGYEEWGLDVLPRLNGMFAFAIWDGRRRRLLLARDRVGIKPLFYSVSPERLVFGSEIKALLAAGVEADIDPWAINQFLAHWYVPTPHSIYKQIAKLEPGCYLLADSDGVRTGRYWNLAMQPEPATRPLEEYDEELRATLDLAVLHQMRSDVPLGAFLSGGLDSGLVTSFMAPVARGRLKTFTIGFNETSYAEQNEAELIAAALGTEHHTELMGVEAVRWFPALVAHFDEPFGDYSLLPTYAVSRLARRAVKVVLTGDGGDECFAGYPTHHVWRAASVYRLLPAPLRRAIAAVVNGLPVSMERISFDYVLRRFLRGAAYDHRRGHYAWKEILDADQRKMILTADIWEQVADDDPFDVFRRYFDEVRDQPILNQLLYVDFKTFLLDDNLVKVDRMSMAASLEVRVPLLDNAVLDFVARAPVPYKLPGTRTKHLLRRLGRIQLPAGISKLKKRGFTPPLPLWLQGPARNLLRDVLSPSAVADLGAFEVAAVQRMIDQHLRGEVDWNRPLFGLLSYALWHQSRTTPRPLGLLA